MADIDLTIKQTMCWEVLWDKKTTDILYGGSAGSGKSYLGCIWITSMCLKYPGIRTLIGRTVLAQLKMTTLNTLFETFAKMELKPGTHYNYNAHSNIITFFNKSEIILKDLQYQPSDPNYDSLAGFELTCCFVDEASQITQLAYSILKSRLRFKLNEYNLKGKILMSCNPANCWLKKDFYVPSVTGMLPKNKAFIQALPLDNPHLPEQYLEMLRTLPIQQRKRLLEGSWDYLDEDDALFDFDSITNSQFKLSPNSNNRSYLTLDVSRFGADRSVAMIWVGMVLMETIVYKKLQATELVENIEELMAKHGIDRSSVIVDSDGVGGPVADMLKGVNFVNNSTPMFKQNFTNLKSQCYVKLSEMIKDGKISINLVDPLIVDELTQELLAVKLKDIDKDGKVAVQSKDEMKRILGKSPDLSDCMMMRMYWELKNFKSTARYAIQFTNY